MRQWLYTDGDVFADAVESGNAIALPDFLKSVEGCFFEAGQQLRILAKLETELKTEEAIVHVIKQISENEAIEMANVCRGLDDVWALCEPGFNEVGLSKWRSLPLNHATPLPFQHNALHEVYSVP